MYIDSEYAYPCIQRYLIYGVKLKLEASWSARKKQYGLNMARDEDSKSDERNRNGGRNQSARLTSQNVNKIFNKARKSEKNRNKRILYCLFQQALASVSAAACEEAFFLFNLTSLICQMQNKYYPMSFISCETP